VGWSIGFDQRWRRDVGYGVPATCDYPGCERSIDRGLAFVCGGRPYGGAFGCGLFFCSDHQFGVEFPLGDLTPSEVEPDGLVSVDDDGNPVIYVGQVCERCADFLQAGGDLEPFTPSLDTVEWMAFKLLHPSWQEWRDGHADEVSAMRQSIIDRLPLMPPDAISRIVAEFEFDDINADDTRRLLRL